MSYQRFDLKTALALALVVHCLIACTVVFYFPSPVTIPKPFFVFLGSFLRPEDVTILARANLDGDNNLNVQNINLDIRWGSLPRNMEKPDLTSRIYAAEKQQFRPRMVQDNQGIKSVTTDDLGIDLTPLPLIKMRLERSDQD